MPGKDALMHIGIELQSLLKDGMSFATANEALVKRIAVRNVDNTGYQKLVLAYFQHNGGATSYAWASNAFATISPSHTLAASLMATSIPAEVANNIKLPWPCFGIAVPPLVNHPAWPTHVLIHKSGNLYRLFFVGDTSFIACTSPDIGRITTKQIVSEERCDDSEEFGVTILGRIQQVIGRLIVGVCLELDTPKEMAGLRKRPSVPKIKRGEPKTWNYQLTRSVKLDVREAVRSYVMGERDNPLSVQSLVMGHQKRQPHGPLLALRKWIHVEPYWRGPEDAPIAVRSHLMGSEGAT